MYERSIRVRRSRIHARGVFAVRRIPKGREIIRYCGKLITHAEADAQDFDDGHTFLFTLNDHWVIDAARGGNAARFINHSCRPNCIAYQIESNSGDPWRDKVIIESLRDIEAGEELSYDYRLEANDPSDPAERALWICRCGAKNCRGTMLRPPRKRGRS